jgi:hypothetical protein
MRLRSLTKHIRDQNWFAVALDFFIVVVGILIAFQITNWSAGRATAVDEREFLNRLHGDILELRERRAEYDKSRPEILEILNVITEFLYGERDDLSAAEALQVQFLPELADFEGLAKSSVCNHFEWTDALTVPPATLPTATEIVSAGRVNDIASDKVKSALQTFLQQSERAEEYISALRKNGIRLTKTFPELFEIRSSKWDYDLDGETFSQYRCDYEAMRSNPAFLNAVEVSVRNYSNYTFRGVFPASEKLAELHQAVDEELGLTHNSEAK